MEVTEEYSTEENPIQEDAVCFILEPTAQDGKTYKTKFYNLDAIIAVGYVITSNKMT